ncbi:MAG TPA: four helix bundle protein [Gemmatimonadaceae bacterium]|nr:four helix bundle protein [Gemmatimonadaceae bacterium]
MVYRRKLVVLDKAHALLVDINKIIPGIRRTEHQPLKKQLFKSALSTSSNLAEGRTKHSQREFLRFLDIALGSAGELQWQLRAAVDCAALAQDDGLELNKRAEEIAKMIQGLMKKIKGDLDDEGPSAAKG